MSGYKNVYLLKSVQSGFEWIVCGFWLEICGVAIWKCIFFSVIHLSWNCHTKKKKKRGKKSLEGKKKEEKRTIVKNELLRAQPDPLYLSS